MTVAVSSVVTVLFADEPAPSNHWLRAERYSYTTVEEDAPDRVLERVTVQFRIGTNEHQTAYTSQHPEGTEQVLIRLTPAEELLAGTQWSSDTNATRISSARIWIEGDQILSELTRGDRNPKRKSSLRNGLEVAAEPSLMNMLRTFPFGTGAERRILMATFSQYVLPMTIRQLGEERVSVPAGSFECYKLEAVVRFFGLKIVTTYWLAKDPPHFLVRYRGRRGLFLAPTYVTELVSGETNGVPIRPSLPTSP